MTNFIKISFISDFFLTSFYNSEVTLGGRKGNSSSVKCIQQHEPCRGYGDINLLDFGLHQSSQQQPGNCHEPTKKNTQQFVWHKRDKLPDQSFPRKEAGIRLLGRCNKLDLCILK